MSEEENETLTEGMETTVAGEQAPEETTEENPIPEGFDDKMYDTETKTLRLDAVKERLDNDTKEMESLKKQRDDMRRKLSKGVNVPDKKEDYDYLPDEKYTPYMEEGNVVGDHIRQCFDKLSDIAFKNGISKEADAAYKEALLQELEVLHIMDTRPEEEIKAEKAKALEKQKEILGENYREIVQGNVDFYKDRGPFNTEERKYLMCLMAQSGHANNIFRKIREMLDGGKSFDIPAASDENSDRDSLVKEYLKNDTTEKRRQQILETAASQGWKVGDYL